MSWPLLEEYRNGAPLAGVICCAESGIQVLRMSDLWVMSDQHGRNIHPYIELGAGLALLPPFDIAPPNEDGERLATLRSGESIGKFEQNCGNESHIALKLGGGLAAVALGQTESYVVGGAFQPLFKRTAKLRFHICDCYGQDGHGAWALPSGLQAGAGGVIEHSAGAPHIAGCVCNSPRFGKWHNGFATVDGL
jgi:hypothetical protein